MQIFVCIKQVPDAAQVEIDPATGVIKREDAPGRLNPWDLFALETALRLREAMGGTVTVGTMGPPAARSIVREAYMMGADAGYVLSDRRLVGADVLATSYALSQAIRALGDFDLIVCGKETTDGDTAQVGPSIAEHMGIPHAAWVSAVEASERGVRAVQQLGNRTESVFMPYPCLMTVEGDIFTPRLPSLKVARQIKARPIAVLSLDDCPDTDASHYGLDGSPTRVERIFPPDKADSHERIEGDGAGERLVERLRALKLL